MTFLRSIATTRLSDRVSIRVVMLTPVALAVGASVYQHLVDKAGEAVVEGGAKLLRATFRRDSDESDEVWRLVKARAIESGRSEAEQLAWMIGGLCVLQAVSMLIYRLQPVWRIGRHRLVLPRDMPASWQKLRGGERTVQTDRRDSR
ncbi:MAG: hypothetical protein M3548_13030 [Actinomycetota bacterium]|nr:hypothetical protein [Actinomycetota bacterium]